MKELFAVRFLKREIGVFVDKSQRRAVTKLKVNETFLDDTSFLSLIY